MVHNREQEDPNALTRPLRICGTAEQRERAKQRVNSIIAEAEERHAPPKIYGADGQVVLSSGEFAQNLGDLPNQTHLEILVPQSAVGAVIGKGGSMIKQINHDSGAMVRLEAHATGDGKMARISGAEPQVERAKQLILDVLAMCQNGGFVAPRNEIIGAGGERIIVPQETNKGGQRREANGMYTLRPPPQGQLQERFPVPTDQVGSCNAYKLPQADCGCVSAHSIEWGLRINVSGTPTATNHFPARSPSTNSL